MARIGPVLCKPLVVVRPDAYLPLELVALLGCIERRESPESIAERCEQIASAYRERPAPNELWDRHRWEIVQLLDQQADHFLRMVRSDAGRRPPHQLNGPRQP